MLYHTFTAFTNPRREEKPSENIVGKGENADNQHFLLFPTMFSTPHKTNFTFSSTFIKFSTNALKLDWSKSCKLFNHPILISRNSNQIAKWLR